MILQFSNKKVEVREEYLKSTISKSTQKELNSYTFKIKVKGKEKFEDFKKEMEKFKEENLNEIDENNNIIRIFNVGNWNYRFFIWHWLDDCICSNHYIRNKIYDG